MKKLSLLLALMLVLLSACGVPRSATHAPSPEGTLRVHYMDVGQGSAALIETDGHYMLFDGGPGDASSKVISYMQALGVDELDFCIVSHYDSDHLSGVVGVLNVFDVMALIAPEEETDSKLYDTYLGLLEEQRLDLTAPRVGNTYTFGEATFTILAPYQYYEGDNNDSVAIRLDFGESSFFFGGDAEEESEWDMLFGTEDLDVDVYTVNHHGSSSSSVPEFVEALSPEVAVISCGRDNDYGHPHEETMETLAAQGATIYRTDEQGDIVATTDGVTISWGSEPFEANTAAATERSANDVTYILNVKNKKFHLPSCGAVENMSDQNKKDFFGTREELLGEDYSPCGSCNP